MAFTFLKRLFGSEPEKAGKLDPMVNAPSQDPAGTGDDGDARNALTIEQVKDFVRHVVTALVDQPEQVRLETAEKGELTIIQIHCFKQDIGKIIGQSGKTISAIRTLVTGTSARLGRRVSVDVMDD